MLWLYLLILASLVFMGAGAFWRAFHLIVRKDVSRLTLYGRSGIEKDARLCLSQGVLFLVFGVISLITAVLILWLGLSLSAIGGLLSINLGVMWFGASIIQRKYQRTS